MLKRLVCVLMLGSLLGLACGCGQSSAPVVEKPNEVPPLPDRNALKPGNPGGGGNPGTPGTAITPPEGITPDPPKK